MQAGEVGKWEECAGRLTRCEGFEQEHRVSVARWAFVR